MADFKESVLRREQFDALQSLHDLGMKLNLVEDAVLRALDGLEGVEELGNASIDYTIKQVFRAQAKLTEAFDHHAALVGDFRRFVARVGLQGQERALGEL